MRYLNRGLLLALFALTCLQAQDITKGSIVGVVRDASGAVVPGATVKLSSPFGDHATTTNDAGAYSFRSLVVGPGYAVSVSQPGFSTATQGNLTVGINQTTTADINLEIGTAAQSVEVTAGATTIDLNTTNSGANLNEDLYKNVPVGRNISSVMAMAPGVSDSVGAGSANPSINGASGLENEYIVNGADTTDPGFGGFGTYSRNYGPLGNGINFDFVQEVQVQTGGFEAQYGEALGGVINVVTKSGTNQYHGDVYGYFQPQQFEAGRKNANPLLVNKFEFLVHQGAIDYGADVGGYILKDKLFFYGGINPLYNHDYKRADPFFANSVLGTIDRSTTTYDYTGKINYNLGTKHQFEGSVFGDPSHTPTTFNLLGSLGTVPLINADGTTQAPDTSLESKLNYGTRTWTGRYNGALSPNWALTVNYSNYYNNFSDTPLENGYQIVDNTPVQEGTGGQITYGGIGFDEASEAKVNQINLSSTHIFRFFGGHTLTYGYQFTDDVYNDIYKYTGAPFQLPNLPELGAAAGQTVFGAEFTRTHLNNDPTQPIVLDFTRGNYSSPIIGTDTRYHAGYIQDSWTFGRITLKPGLRFEQQNLVGIDSHYALTHNWAPRLGVIVDPFNDRKTKIYASYGRFFEKVPLDIAVRALSVELSITGAYYQDPGPNNQPNVSTSAYIPGGPIAFQGSAASIENVAAGTGAQFQDEITAGYEHEFAHNLTFTGRFVYRDLRRIIEDMSGINVTQALAGVPQIYVVGNPSRALDIFQNAAPCSNPGVGNCVSYANPFGPGQVGFTAFANGTTNPLGSDSNPDGFPNPSRVYKSMELIISKRFSNNFQFYGSYVLSKLYGNYQGNFRSDNGQQDPNISSMFDFTNSDGLLTGQDIPGLLNSDRTHQFKLFGNYVWRGLNLGASWLPTSGNPITDLLDHPAYLNAGEIPVCPSSSGPEPLSGNTTAASFSCSGGPRGKFGRTAWTYDFNLHADYTIKLGERARVKLVADLFNIFNEQKVNRPNQFGEQGGSPGTANPDFLKPGLGQYANPYELPFHARLGVRFEF